MDLVIATLKFIVNFVFDQFGAQVIDFILGLF